MKSWVLTKPKTFTLEEQEGVPLSDKNSVKIRLDAAVISTADLRLYGGKCNIKPYPITPGRQGAGVISEVFEDNDCCFVKGDRVVVDPHMSCGNCLYCKTNRDHLCTDAKVLGANTNGLYTNFKTLDCNMLHKIPEHMSNQTALFTEYVAMGLSIIDKINLQEGEHVAIFAANKIGFILAQLVTYYQGIAIVLDKNEAQLEKLTKEKIGFTINPEKGDFKQTIKEITGGRNCEKVVYIFNNTTTLQDAIDCCSFNGLVCLSGIAPLSQNGDFSEIHRKQLTVVASSNGHKYFPSAINLLATKTVRIAALVGETVKFADVPKAFEKGDAEATKYTLTEIVID